MKQTLKTLLTTSLLSVAILAGLLLPEKPTTTNLPDSSTPELTKQKNSSQPTKSSSIATSSQTKSLTTSTKATLASNYPSEHKISKHEQLQKSVAHEYKYHLFGTVNDPHYGINWALQTVSAPAAWDIATGDNQTVVAVIDSGFALAHEDLTNQWKTNSGETGTTKSGDICWTGTPANKQTNNCDDDDNSYIDDWRGWSFANMDNNPQAGRTNPTGNGVTHGTVVSGLVGATGNNGIGTTAINQATKIMPLQALDDDGIGYTSDVAAAIYYAIDNGADVINLSLGSYSSDPVLKTAIDFAILYDIVVIAASGNCGDGLGSECDDVPAGTMAYPAQYPDVLSVGATTQSDTHASFSSYGEALDVSAPGANLPVSTMWSQADPTSLYATSLYGTSFAAPQVSSLAALIRSIRPNTSAQDISAIISATAFKPDDMNGSFYSTQFGHGIIDAAKALQITQALNTSSATPTLRQAGSYVSEHTTPANQTIGSGCKTTVGNACTVEITNQSNDHKRYLPYTIIPGSGSVGWSWSSSAVSSGYYEIRALRGDNRSDTPYFLQRY